MANDLLAATSATAAASMALQTSMLKKLAQLGIITADQAFEIVDEALLNIEQQRGNSPHIHEVLDLARTILEQGMPPRRSAK